MPTLRIVSSIRTNYEHEVDKLPIKPGPTSKSPEFDRRKLQSATIHFYSNMDDVEIMPDDSFSTAGGDQLEIDIEDSTSQGTRSDFSESRKAKQQVYFFGKIKTIFEVSDDRTAEEAKKFLKVHNLTFYYY